MKIHTLQNLSLLDDQDAKDVVNILTNEIIKYFQSVCKDKAYFSEILLQSLVKEKLVVCKKEEKVVGVMIYDTLEDKLKMVRAVPLIKGFGLIKGLLTYRNLTRKAKTLKSGQVYLDMIITHPMYRHQGIATAMIQHVCATVPAREYTLDVRKDNLAAVCLYKKLGFKVGDQKYEDDDLYMIKSAD